MSGSWVHVDNKVSTKLSGIFKEAIFVYLTPTIQVPAKSGHFTIVEDDFFFYSSPFRASSSVYGFNLIEKTNHISGGIFPFPKTSRVGANREALHREVHKKMT